ncbi:beta-ketoacyl-ACP synthase III [Periweissella fabalis]|uniref:Beta-ketoacyl-[acyl-carrier-protein] synthase III n=1 Tax=Periweissella fabalis TaxID=1070421 RepID=A0A7X6S2K4_9LACO|nr:beta-ketoacyl-ACP synthase III [Periweissella fabalis]MCM0598549.1 ketoacyl-ACP synthase III [Periweissella fabalis]NKZ24169.1 ketoacyl-ACP synthase III [Periweissella fabalis]
MAGIRILETAHYVPERIVENEELTHYMDTSDEWISSRTGISRRHVVTTENTSDVTLKVAQQLLSQADLDATKLDFILVATMSPDYLTPGVAAQVQGALGATNAFALDVNAACAGFVYALSVADKMIAQGQYGLVIGADVLSKLIDWDDRTSAVLFGDGAGGFLVKGEPISAIHATDLATFGVDNQAIRAGKIANKNAFVGEITPAEPYFAMIGRDVYNFATRQVPISIVKALNNSGLTLEDIDKVLLHQANGRMVEQIAKKLKQPLDKFPTNITEYGNTSAASIPILADELIKNQTIKRGDKLVLTGFGGGLSLGTTIITY